MADEPVRLNSWKEIARYLDREVRTVMRWEKEHALPIHRVPPGGKGRSVFAYSHELDRWLEEGRALSHEKSAPVAEHPPSRILFRQSSFWLGLGLAVVGAVALIASLPTWRTDAAAEIAQVVYQGNRLVAVDGAGQILWWHQPDPRLRRMPGHDKPESFIQHDLDGDGTSEVLVSDNFYVEPSNVEEGRLFCFSHKGSLRWKYLFEDTLNFGEGQFRPPWRGGPLVSYSGDNGPRIAWSVRHIWWPSVVVVLDQTGTPLNRFVNPGWILNLSAVETHAGWRLLAGGINNEHSSAMLAILDGNNASGSPPSAGRSRFQCLNRPSGHPLHYLLFPRSELNIASGLPHNRINAVDVTEYGFNLRCLEADAPLPTSAERIFEMNLDFAVTRVRFSDGYWSYHRLQELEERLNHLTDSCPERSGPLLIRSWTPENDWSEIDVPR